ncbi:hypothetical protein, partial [Aeromonas caviae]|uniref:hypothetical protein n=1 Tax=Aeromonas caviae TaxID=648 RepID=UPI00403F7A34
MTRQHTPKGGNEDAGDSLKGPINFFQKSPTLSFQWLFNFEMLKTIKKNREVVICHTKNRNQPFEDHDVIVQFLSTINPFPSLM